MPLNAIYAALPFKQHSNIPSTLGCELTEQGYIKVNEFQQTSIKGILACGDNAGMMRSVVNAVATGSLAGSMTNKELVDHPFGATLKYIAIGIETKAPTIAALFVVFFQNNPKIKMAKIPGLTTPVYS